MSLEKPIKITTVSSAILTTLSFFFLLNPDVHAQTEADLYPTRRKIILPAQDSTLEFEVEIVEADLADLQDNATYHWFSSDKIYKSVGGFEGQLLDGVYIVKAANGQLKRKGYFKQGLKIKHWKEWYENGQLKSRVEWEEGKKEGIYKSWNKEGIMLNQYTFEEDIKDGPYYIYHSSGELAEEGKMKYGEKRGMVKSYYKNGEVESKIRFRDGVKDGWSKVYDQEGELKYKQKYKAGELIPKMEENKEEEEKSKKWQFWKDLSNSCKEEEKKGQE